MRFMFVALLMVGLATRGLALECYECDDCEELGDASTKTCSDPLPGSTTESSTDPSTESTTESTTESSTEPSTETTIDPGKPGMVHPTIIPHQPEKVHPTVIPDQPEKVYPTILPYDQRLRRAIREDEGDKEEYRCFVAELKKGENDEFKTKRGCVKSKGQDDGCDKVKEGYSKIEHCRTCSEDKCNSAMSLSISSLAVILSLLLVKFSY